MKNLSITSIAGCAFLISLLIINTTQPFGPTVYTLATPFMIVVAVLSVLAVSMILLQFLSPLMKKMNIIGKVVLTICTVLVLSTYLNGFFYVVSHYHHHQFIFMYKQFAMSIVGILALTSIVTLSCSWYMRSNTCKTKEVEHEKTPA